MMIVHWIRLVFHKNALILATASYAVVGLNVGWRDTKQFASVLLGCKETRLYLVLKSVANLMMIVLQEKNAILLSALAVEKNACHYVLRTLVLGVPAAQHKIIRKFARVTLP